ncbi:hypothetical protein [Halomonas denitrificans]|nr:hypothetical protein [Halomonas denitrificans]
MTATTDGPGLPGLRRATGAPLLPVIGLAVLLALSCLATGCGSPPPAEERIFAIIGEMEVALERGEVDDFMDPVADDFIAGNRGLDRRMLGLLVRRERMARERIAVSRFDTDVVLRGEDRATATFTALATGGSGLLPDEGRLWRIDTGWRLDDGDWRLIHAEWRPAGAG